jgi:P4 family phage/plasmid primase-like protien
VTFPGSCGVRTLSIRRTTRWLGWSRSTTSASTTKPVVTPKTRYLNAPTNAGPDDRPGTDFNNQVPIEQYIGELGFTEAPTSGGDRHFWHPGKGAPEGTSATIFANAPDRVVMFSQTYGGPQSLNPAVELHKNYDAFGLYAAVNHAGDIKAATKALAAKGYGKQSAASSASSAAPTVRPMTDLGNAQWLVDEYGENLRYVELWNRWIWWNGSRWQFDGLKMVAYYAALIARDAWDAARSNPTDLLSWARKCQSRAGIEAMCSLAKSDRRIIIHPDRLDCNPGLLAVANGTIDLKTGILRAPQREDLITKGSPVVFDPTATCPLWDAFMERVQPDPEVRAFMQRMFGYMLTSETREEKLFFFYGSGANGKSVVVSVHAGILGEYCKFMPEDFLTSEVQPAHVMADLQGRREALANETNQYGQVSEKRLKALTTYTKVSGRHLYGNWFDFTPSHKIVVVGNHQPNITATDDGTWRRFDEVDFNVTIPKAEQDTRLPEKLVAEYPGILAQAVRGAVEWYQNGLQEPAAVIRATGDYRHKQDVLGRFIEERLVFDDRKETLFLVLKAALKGWCDAEGIACPDPRSLSNRLRKDYNLGEPRKSHGEYWWAGVRVADPDMSYLSSLIPGVPESETPEIRVSAPEAALSLSWDNDEF